MSDLATDASARSEAAQPSLWDRLADDLPGITAEMAVLREDLADCLGGEKEVDKLLNGGLAALRRRSDLDEKAFRLGQALIRRKAEHDRIEARGVVVTGEVLREAVRRDIEMLFNIERFETNYLLTERESRHVVYPGDLLADYPEVRTSVINYGVPAFSGRNSLDFDKDALAREIRAVVTAFEPRLRKDSIKVQVRYNEQVGMRIEIDAILMLSPVPERLRLSTTIDLENGRASTTREEL